MNKPSPLLVAGLGATLLAAYFAPTAPQDDGVQLSVRSQAAPASPAREAPSAAVEGQAAAAAQSPAPRVATAAAAGSRADGAAATQVLRIRPRDGAADALEPSTWFPAPARPVPVARPAPPPPPAPAPAPPPPPQAPPLPFKPLGRYVDGDQSGVFLQYRDQAIVARVGDTLPEQYKVESLSGGVLTLRYLPLDQTQTLDLGLANH